jgi:hypothetical protein
MYLSKETKISDAETRVGIVALRGLTNKEYSANQRRAFFAKHGLAIRKITQAIPKKKTQTTAVLGAVLLKCSRKYGLDKALEMANNLKAMCFTGPDDPAHLLWAKIYKGKPANRDTFYKLAVTACRAYCEDRTLSNLHMSKTDIFEWDSNWEYND